MLEAASIAEDLTRNVTHINDVAIIVAEGLRLGRWRGRIYLTRSPR